MNIKFPRPTYHTIEPSTEELYRLNSIRSVSSYRCSLHIHSVPCSKKHMVRVHFSAGITHLNVLPSKILPAKRRVLTDVSLVDWLKITICKGGSIHDDMSHQIDAYSETELTTWANLETRPRRERELPMSRGKGDVGAVSRLYPIYSNKRCGAY